jgi:hypothetical protein
MLANFYLIIFPREINGYQQIPTVSAHPPIQFHRFAPIHNHPHPRPINYLSPHHNPTRRIIATAHERLTPKCNNQPNIHD